MSEALVSVFLITNDTEYYLIYYHFNFLFVKKLFSTLKKKTKTLYFFLIYIGIHNVFQILVLCQLNLLQISPHSMACLLILCMVSLDECFLI